MHKEQLEKFYEAFQKQVKELFGFELSKEVVQASILKRKAELVEKFPGDRIASLSYQDLITLEQVIDERVQVKADGSEKEQQVPADGRTCGNEKALCKGRVDCSNCQGNGAGQGDNLKVPEAVHNSAAEEGKSSGTGSAKKDSKHDKGKRPKGK